MSHNTASIASIWKIRVGLDSSDFKLDYDTIKVNFTFLLITLLTHKPRALFWKSIKIGQKQGIKSNEKLHSLKARSHDPFLRIRFLVPKTGSMRSDGPISRFRFCGEDVGRSFVVCSHDPFFRTNKESSIWRVQNLSVPFIFQGECRMKIEEVLFPSVFSKLGIRLMEGHF